MFCSRPWYHSCLTPPTAAEAAKWTFITPVPSSYCAAQPREREKAKGQSSNIVWSKPDSSYSKQGQCQAAAPSLEKDNKKKRLGLIRPGFGKRGSDALQTNNNEATKPPPGQLRCTFVVEAGIVIRFGLLLSRGPCLLPRFFFPYLVFRTAHKHKGRNR